MSRGTVLLVLKKIVGGVVSGIVYYLVYAVILPVLISYVTNIPVPAPSSLIVYAFFFIALSTAGSVLSENPVSIPLRTLLKLLGVLVLWSILNGGHLAGTVNQGELVINFEADISPLLYVVILVSLVYGFLDAFAYFTNTTHRTT